MKRQTTQDERILIQSRKILSEAYSILMIVLLTSILVQQFLFDAPFEQYAVECICFFGVSIYILIRKLTLGINMFGERKPAERMPLMNSIVTGITITVVNGVLNYTKYAENYKDKLGFFIITLLITFACATVGSFVMLSFVNYLNNKKQMQIQKKLDKEEQDN
ncbi:MAG: DUF6773 family protein [Dehalobacterium sp.]